jgi:hypothetical protein
MMNPFPPGNNSGGQTVSPAGLMEEDIIGAIKIKDGLFIGDEFAAQVCS